MRTRTVQSNFLSGVLDPRAAGRVETEAYNNGLLLGENVIVHHLGGVVRRPGLKFQAQLPNVLSLLEPETITTPEGDTDTTPANASDDDLSTAVEGFSIGTTDPFVLVHYDMGEGVEVHYADVLRIKLTSGTTDEFFIQWSVDNSNWFNYGNALSVVDTVERSYRRYVQNNLASHTTATSPPNDKGDLPRYWRVVKIGGTDLSTADASLAEFRLWADTGTISNVRFFPLEVDANSRFVMAVTDQSITALELDGGIPKVFMPGPYASADIPDLDGAEGAEALFLTHEDYPPRFVERRTEQTFELFLSDEIEFDAIPQYDYDDDDSPTPTSEVQVITFDANWTQGDTFQIELDGARTGLITFAGDATSDEQVSTATNIAREIQKLFSVPGFTGVTCSRTGSLAYTVTFADASAKEYEGLMGVTPGTTSNSSVPTATVTRSATGVPRQEDLWSSTRGYPRTVTFFEGRLYFGGFRSRLQTLVGSAVNDILNFELGQQLAADPLFITLNTQSRNIITGIHSGRTLELFTTAAEFRYIRRQGEPITPSDAPVLQTQYGTKRVRPVAIDGSTLFIQRLGKSVRDFRFDLNEDAYNSLGLSSLAPHLISNAVDINAWKGTSTDEINLVFVINDDGTVAVLNLRKEADVRAWTKWSTQGDFKAVGVSAQDVFFAIQRNVGGANRLLVETVEYDLYLDSAKQGALGSSASTLFHMPSTAIRVRLDPDHVVLDNQTTLSTGDIPEQEGFEGEDVQVGLGFVPTVRPMPLQSMTPLGSNFLDKRRVKRIRAKVYETLGLLVNDRPLPDRYADIDDFDLDPTPFSGNHAIEETSNWDETEDKLVTFSQVDPLPMNILSISVDMESS